MNRIDQEKLDILLAELHYDVDPALPLRIARRVTPNGTIIIGPDGTSLDVTAGSAVVAGLCDMLLENGVHQNVLLDVRRCTHFSSVTLGRIAHLAGTCAEAEHLLIIIRPGKDTEQMLHLTRLDQVLRICSSHIDACGLIGEDVPEDYPFV